MFCINIMSTSSFKPRRFMQPANLPGHKYAGPLALSGPRMPSWRNAPFVGAAAPGTKNRSSERVQAHRDRIQIMKAHHAQGQQKLKAYKQQAKNQEQAALKLRRNLQTARAMSKGSRTQQNRDKYSAIMNRTKVALARHREDQQNVDRMVRLHTKELKKLEKEINKVAGRMTKNKAMVKKR